MSGRDKLANAFFASQPEAAASLLETLAPDDVATLLTAADADAAAAVLGRMLPGAAARCAERLPIEREAEIVERMDSQDAIALLRQLHRDARARLLGALRPQWSAAYDLLLRYPPSTVGAWADPFVATLPIEATVAEARERVERDDGPARARIYVLDRGRRVRGAVRGLALVRPGGDARLASVVEPVTALWARETLAAAVEHTLWERDAEAPVVTRDQEFVGVAAYADLRRALRRQSRAEHPPERMHGLTEVAELFATGAGGIWASVGELVQRRSR